MPGPLWPRAASSGARRARWASHGSTARRTKSGASSSWGVSKTAIAKIGYRPDPCGNTLQGLNSSPWVLPSRATPWSSTSRSIDPEPRGRLGSHHRGLALSPWSVFPHECCRYPLLDGDAGETPSAAVGRRGAVVVVTDSPGRPRAPPPAPRGPHSPASRTAPRARERWTPPPRRPSLRGPGRGAGVAPQDQPVALLGALTSRPPMGRALNLEPPRRHGEDPARTEPCVVVHGLDIGTVQESLHTSPRAGRTRSGPVLWSRRPGIAVKGLSGAFSGGGSRRRRGRFGAIPERSAAGITSRFYEKPRKH